MSAGNQIILPSPPDQPKAVDTLAEVTRRIGEVRSAILAEGATALYVYGSRARGDHRSDSDLDVFVDFEPGTGFSLLEIAGIKITLEGVLGLDVHVTTRASLHPLLRDAIEREAVRVL